MRPSIPIPSRRAALPVRSARQGSHPMRIRRITHPHLIPTLFVLLLAAGVARAAEPAPAAAPKDQDFDLPKTWVLDLEVIDKASGEAIPNLAVVANNGVHETPFSTDS